MVDLAKLTRMDESRHSRNQERDFAVRNRRNRLAGLWAAERMGLNGEPAARYAADIVGEAIVKPGDTNLIAILLRDLNAGGVQFTEPALRDELAQFGHIAAMELGASHPDHPRAA